MEKEDVSLTEMATTHCSAAAAPLERGDNPAGASYIMLTVYTVHTVQPYIFQSYRYCLNDPTTPTGIIRRMQYKLLIHNIFFS